MCFQIFQIQLQHRITFFHGLTAFYQCLKSLSVQFYCINSDMNQKADPGIGYKSNRMFCVKNKRDFSVLRSTHIRIFRCHNSAVSHHLFCKRFIRRSRKVGCQSAYRAADSNRIHNLLFFCFLRRFRLFWGWCIFCFRIRIRSFFQIIL